MPAMAREVTSLDVTTASCGFRVTSFWNLDKAWENSFALLFAVGLALRAGWGRGLMPGGLRRKDNASPRRGVTAAEAAETGRGSELEASGDEVLVDSCLAATGFRSGGVCVMCAWPTALALVPEEALG